MPLTVMLAQPVVATQQQEGQGPRRELADNIEYPDNGVPPAEVVVPAVQIAEVPPKASAALEAIRESPRLEGIAEMRKVSHSEGSNESTALGRKTY
jgi:hypothetical protein